MNIKSNFSMPLMEFRELKSGDCFVWFEEGELGTKIYMRLEDIETEEDIIENAYVDLETGEVTTLEPFFCDSLVLLVELNATAGLSAN